MKIVVTGVSGLVGRTTADGHEVVGVSRKMAKAPETMLRGVAEIVRAPQDLRDRAERRRVERERLSELHMPAIFDTHWVAGGVVHGRVRVVDPDTVDDFGGAMSHTAVVAREYGVPRLVDTQTAATRLRDGDLVEIDPHAGRLSVIEHANPSIQESA